MGKFMGIAFFRSLFPSTGALGKCFLSIYGNPILLYVNSVPIGPIKDFQKHLHE
jgi:hypothetical protein